MNVVTEISPVKVQEHEPGGQDEVHHLPRHLHLLTHQGNRGIMVTNCSTWKILNNATLSFTFDFDYVCRSNEIEMSFLLTQYTIYSVEGRVVVSLHKLENSLIIWEMVNPIFLKLFLISCLTL